MTTAVVIGGGPAGLMAADVLSTSGVEVIVADKMPSVGRKFLMAGKSGLNLTKAEPLPDFIENYWSLPVPLRDAIAEFGPDDVMRWAKELGQEIFVGSTGRVFPTVMKASPLLRAWLARLGKTGVQFNTRWDWKGWNGKKLFFETPEGPQELSADVTILALGGGSWARLGSDGQWQKHLNGTVPFVPSNCGFKVDWSPYMAKHFGKPIKATRLKAGSRHSRGEWILSERGIEGGGVYEISHALRTGAALEIDLLPDIDLEALKGKWAGRPRKVTVANFLRTAFRSSGAKIALVQEIAKANQTNNSAMPTLLKALPIPVIGPFPLDEAISTAGGLAGDKIEANLMLKSRPGVFCAGEMLDWDAPTGGYLLTACLASGRLAGRSAVQWLDALES